MDRPDPPETWIEKKRKAAAFAFRCGECWATFLGHLAVLICVSVPSARFARSGVSLEDLVLLLHWG